MADGEFWIDPWPEHVNARLEKLEREIVFVGLCAGIGTGAGIALLIMVLAGVIGD